MVNTDALVFMRKSAGLTQGELAGMLGYRSYRSYMYKERGDTEFSDEEKLKLVEILNMNLHQFYYIFFDNKFHLASCEFQTGFVK